MLHRQLEQHKAGLSQAQQDYGNEARRQKQLDAQANKLGGHLDKARAHADQADKTTAMHSDSEPFAPLPHGECQFAQDSLIFSGPICLPGVMRHRV